MTSPAIQAFLEKLHQRRARGQEIAAIPPETERGERQPLYPTLQWSVPPGGVDVVQQRPPAPQLPLEVARQRIYDEIMAYATGEDERVLLLRVPPGVGKSYQATRALQDLVDGDGWRAMYTAARKNFWGDDLTRFPIFQPDKWWNWLAISPGNEERGEPMTCRVSEAMGEWLRRGYPGIELCKQLCIADGWIHNCEYRKQAKRCEPCIFARHNHLSFGVSFKEMSLAVVDELPLNAFLYKQFIPTNCIVPDGSAGPVTELFEWLKYLAESKQWVKSKSLLDLIGETLGDVYAQVEVDPNALPEIPLISGPEEITSLPFNYWMELLCALELEYEVWRGGWNDWVPRVKVRPGGLELLRRREVWEHLPNKVVMLDATGDPNIAQAIFERPVKLVECSVEMKGRIFQVVGRQNGISQVWDKKTQGPSRQGRDMLESVKLIRDEMGYKDIGIITFLKLEPTFEQEFGFGNVLHYYGQRGTNLFEGKEAVFLCGAPNWPLTGIANTAAMLFKDRMDSFIKDKEGQWVYPWRSAACEYRVKDGRRAWRWHRGFWKDHELKTVMDASRVSELVQAAHRGRPILYSCDIWVLTSIPTPLVIDGAYQDLGDLWFTPARNREASSGPSWRAWLKLRPWLNEQWEAAGQSEDGVWITSSDLAAVAGVTPDTARCQMWLSAIAAHSEKWHIEPRVVAGRGRPTLGLIATEV